MQLLMVNIKTQIIESKCIKYIVSSTLTKYTLTKMYLDIDGYC